MAQAIQMQRKNDNGVYENYYPNTVMSQVEGDIAMKAKVVITARAGDNIAVSGDATQTVIITDSGTATIYLSYGNYTFINNRDNFTVKLNIDTVKTYEILVKAKSLNDYSWAEISEISVNGNAPNKFAIGDAKAVNLDGTASKLSLNTTLYCYILGFDHDKSSASGAADGITFGTFKTAASNGVDVCLVSGYSNDSDFRMNTTATNSGGWKSCDMRYNILGSTNTQNGDATATTATSPKANTLMSCLPSDLRAMMRPMYIYTDNTGGSFNAASRVTGTLDYLPLLAEFEVFGTRTNANSAEQNYQTQYQYYKDGNSKVKYDHSNTSSAVIWWVRSPYYNNNNSFCTVYSNGSINYANAISSCGVAPMFKV